MQTVFVSMVYDWLLVCTVLKMSLTGVAVARPKLTLDLFGSSTLYHYACIQGPIDNPSINETKKKAKTKIQQTLSQALQIDDLLMSDQTEAVVHEGRTPRQIRKLCRDAINKKKMFVDGNMVRVQASAPELQIELKKLFAVTPWKTKNSRKRKSTPAFPLWIQSEDDILVPRIPLIEDFPKLAADEELNTSVTSLTYSFDGTLREYQVPIVDHIVKCLKNRPSHSGLLQADPGTGKTCMICCTISKLQVPPLILVHNTKLLQQWVQQIKRWLPHCTVGIYKGKQRPPHNANVCIASLQTVMRREFKQKDLARFQAVFIDETHHIAAQCFSRALAALQPQYTLGCTATLDRTDRLDGWIEVLVGPLLYQLRREIDADVWKVEYMHADWIDPLQKWSIDKDYVQALTNLVNLKHRTRVIAKVINKLVKEGRQLICIASRQKMCIDVYNLLRSAGISAGIMTTDLTTKNAIDEQVLIGTNGMLGEGFDDSKRNTVVLMTPFKGIERVPEKVSKSKKRGGSQLIQIVGRGLRAQTDHRPLVVDITDVGTMFEYMWSSRNIYYTQKQMKRRPTTVVHARP